MPGNAFQAFEVGQAFDRLQEPAAHLRAGVLPPGAITCIGQTARPSACRHRQTASRRFAGGNSGQTASRCQSQTPCFADIVIAAGVADFHRAIADCVQHLQARHDFAASEHADVEFTSVSRLARGRPALQRRRNGVRLFRGSWTPAANGFAVQRQSPARRWRMRPGRRPRLVSEGATFHEFLLCVHFSCDDFLSACIRQFLASAVTDSLLSIPQNTKNNIMQCSNIGHTFTFG